mmetsp:Transcript_11506/g.30594  ORF Transcript_11506/g.30594 Transcript_11506/m.30594 type:complete len:130 (-) Transcript_11506:1883-2272(-)
MRKNRVVGMSEKGNNRQRRLRECQGAAKMQHSSRMFLLRADSSTLCCAARLFHHHLTSVSQSETIFLHFLAACLHTAIRLARDGGGRLLPRLFLTLVVKRSKAVGKLVKHRILLLSLCCCLSSLHLLFI